MKSYLTKSVLCFSALTTCYSLHAQRERRTCDVEPQIIVSRDTFQTGEKIPVEVLFHNNGPDKMVTGDGIIVIMYTDIEGQKTSLLENILAGQGNDSIPLDEAISFRNSLNMNTANRTEPLTFDFCVQIASEAVVNGEDMLMAYSDPNKSNDLVCRTLTIMPGNATAITKNTGLAIAWQLYPNPASDKLYINTGQHIGPEDIQIRISDITGRAISTQTYKSRQIEQGPLALDLTKLPAGLYTLSLQTGKEISTAKFRIAR